MNISGMAGDSDPKTPVSGTILSPGRQGVRRCFFFFFRKSHLQSEQLVRGLARGYAVFRQTDQRFLTLIFLGSGRNREIDRIEQGAWRGLFQDL